MLDWFAGKIQSVVNTQESDDFGEKNGVLIASADRGKRAEIKEGDLDLMAVAEIQRDDGEEEALGERRQAEAATGTNQTPLTMVTL